MKLLSSYRYQVHDQRMAIVVFYGVMVGMVLLNLLFLPFANAADANLTVTSGGITAVTMVFSFILSLCAFKDSFLLNIQHGISRRSQFLARMGAMATVCGAMAVADEIYTLLISLLSFPFPNSFFARSLYEICYCTDVTSVVSSDFTYTVSTSGASAVLSIVFSFFVLLAVNAFGYLITAFNYRLGKVGKIILWTGWPCLLIAGSAILEVNPWLEKMLLSFFVNFSRICLSSLPRLCLTCLGLTAVFSGLTWLVMRRTAVK